MILSTTRSLSKLFRQQIVLRNSAKTSGPAFSSASQRFCKTLEDQSSPEVYKKVFLFPHITKIAAFTKIKIYMTCLTFAATPLVGSIDPATGAVFGTFLGFSSAALLLIGESARRTVGIVYLNENKDKVKIARLSFWGRRTDQIFPIDQINLLSDSDEDPQDVFWKIKFDDPKQRSLFISTKYGGVEDPEAFKFIFGDQIMFKQ